MSARRRDAALGRRVRRHGGPGVAIPSSGARPGHPPAATESLLYLYGVVEAGTAAERLLAERQVPGLQPDAPLFPLAADGLVAAVSCVPAAVFQEAPLNALVADLARLAPLAVRHEEAVRALLPLAPALIPMTFGAVYRDAARVLALLRERGPELRQHLNGVRAKHEWGLKVYRDSARWLAAAEAASPELQRLATEAEHASPGRAYLLRKQHERLVASEADRLAAEALEAMVERLASVSAAARRGPAATGGSGGAPVVLSGAFLVPVIATERFRAVAADLERAYAPRGLQPEISGPWAPYSFVGGSRAST